MPQHMTLTPFEWMLVMGIASFAWFLMRRDFQSRDALASAVAGLTAEVASLRSWISERYVSKEDHRREMDRMVKDIEAHAVRFQFELESHRTECPGRKA